jgi:hypothetical protein
MEDEVVAEGLLLPRKISTSQLERGAKGACRIRSSPSPWDPARACVGLAIWEQQPPGPAGKACQEPWGLGPGVAGS